MNTIGSEKLLQAQVQTIGPIPRRLVNRTVSDVEGWKKVLPIPDFFKKYSVNPDDLDAVF